MIADSWASEELSLLEPKGLRRALEPLTSPQGPEVVIRGEERLINFSSNDYLGLAADAELAAAAKLAVDQFGTGSGASRLVVGDNAAHRLLERQLAAFEGSQSALLFNSGYAANVGAISALCGPGDVVFSDALNHASIIDGCRLSRAKTVVYPHRDVAALAQLLKEHSGRRRLVVTDSVFSMDGDRAPLRALEALCREAAAALMVDEAHATGVIGPTGAGLCEELGVEADLRMGTLSKALGGFGAWIACSSQVRELLFHRARSLVFSTSLPPMVCAAAAAAVNRVKSDPSLRAKLWKNIRTFSDGLKALGRPAHEDSAIFPVVLGSPDAAVAASLKLRSAGLLVKAIRPPTVPEGKSLLRFALSAAHTEEHLQRALEGVAGL